MTASTKNHYELLGVARDATIQQIRDSYKELARIYHPDSHFFDDILAEAGLASEATAMPPPSPEAEETFKLITEAYNTLNNATKRTEYDALLPRETPDWDADVKSDFTLEQRNRQFQNPNAATPFSWGAFGRVEDGSEAPPARDLKVSAPTQEELAYRSMSEIIRQQNSLTARIKRIFGL